MTKCSALYCSNSSAKGFPMYKFPIDKQKRMFWVKKMGRHNWVPGPNDALCCVHFTRKLVTKRKSISNGKCSVMMTVVPTVFDYVTIKKRSKQITDENAKKFGTEVKNTLCNLCESSKRQIAKLKKKMKQVRELSDWIIVNDIFNTAKNQAQLSLLLNNNKGLGEKIEIYEILLSYFLSETKLPD